MPAPLFHAGVEVLLGESITTSNASDFDTKNLACLGEKMSKKMVVLPCRQETLSDALIAAVAVCKR